jgi:hypothetical protein
MVKYPASILIPIITIFSCIDINAQENSNPIKKPLRNDINVYTSLFEFNMNYERNIFQLPKSYTNLRLGFGLLYSSIDGGYYYNPALVHLFGKKNRHLEVDLGFKYAVQKGYSNSFIPDIFAGYRYEKPSGDFIFRIGVNIFTLFNIGFGYKF